MKEFSDDYLRERERNRRRCEWENAAFSVVILSIGLFLALLVLFYFAQ